MPRFRLFSTMQGLSRPQPEFSPVPHSPGPAAAPEAAGEEEG